MKHLSLRLDWISALATGNPEVDDQHRRLFDLYNQVLEAPEGQVNRDTVLAALGDYAIRHFQDEEAWMESICYPEEALTHHKKTHTAFLLELEHLKTRPLYLTLDYFREWLLRHIMAEDRQIRVFLGLKTDQGNTYSYGPG